MITFIIAFSNPLLRSNESHRTVFNVIVITVQDKEDYYDGKRNNYYTKRNNIF